MRAFVCLVPLLAASNARAELFEMSGTLTCGSTTDDGKRLLPPPESRTAHTRLRSTGERDARQDCMVADHDQKGLRKWIRHSQRA
jgi:hypothetical protein